MLVEYVQFGKILMGCEVHGIGVAKHTSIKMQFRGEEGGPGMYHVEPLQTVASGSFEARLPQ